MAHCVNFDVRLWSKQIYFSDVLLFGNQIAGLI